MVNQYLGRVGLGDVLFFFWVGDGGEAFFSSIFSVSLWEDECWQVDVGYLEFFLEIKHSLQGSRLEIMRFPSFAL